jgi:DNA helicase-2/ATP-dependent DNA helicase PcrA
MPAIKNKKSVPTAPHIIVKALAGTGKTTTAVEGSKRILGLKSAIKGSVEQEAIWEAMKVGPKPTTIAMVAFNKSIAEELQRRVPHAVQAMTMHSLGLKACKAAFGHCKVNGWRSTNILERAMGDVAFAKFKKESFMALKMIGDIVSLCKQTLVDWNDEQSMDDMLAHYGIELNGDRSTVLGHVATVMELSVDPTKDKEIDFDDMIWLPVRHNLPVEKFDLLIVDECQDLNRARQELALMFGRRLMLIGDENQAIYGFAGADSDSMFRMETHLSAEPNGCTVLPLTETRRCGKAIVAKAVEYVPGFKAHETCPAGEVLTIKGEIFHKEAGPGDLVLCRTNAPLVQQAFRWIKERVPCYIRGRDIGSRLTTIVKKSKAETVTDLFPFVEQWRETHVAKELAKKNPSDIVLQSIHDTCDCVMMFATNCKSISEVLSSIESMFSDDAKANSRQLSSIHKAKGLEADRVWILRPDLLPGPWAKLPWEVQQERNLIYVAITRAINTLCFVPADKPGNTPKTSVADREFVAHEGSIGSPEDCPF